MTKADLTKKIADQVGLSKATAAKSLERILEEIKKSLNKDKKVILVGFGTFSVSKRKARNGRNPQTGNPIAIKASKVPKFSAGKTLKDALN